MPAVGTSAPPGTTIRCEITLAHPTIRPSSKAANERSGSITCLSLRTSSGSGRVSANAMDSAAKKPSTSSGVIVRNSMGA
jgi:hypothetical protein